MKTLVIHPCSIFIIFLVTFLISTNVPASVSADDNYYYTNCNAPFSCQSSIPNLKYPFWGGNRDKYCGQPDMEVTCEGSVPKITISTIKYRILAWDNTTQKLTVARDDYWSGICLSNTNSDYKNNTFDNTQFMLDVGLIVNVTLLYDCPGDLTGTPVNNSETCDDGKVVYYIFEYYSAFVACTKVIVQIFGTQVHSEIADALNDGFGLKWTGDYGACNTCIESHGECGYDEGQFRCLCKDGPHATTCESERVSLSVSGKGSSKTVAIGIGAAGAVAVLAAILGCVYYMVQRRKRTAEQSRSKDLFMPPSSKDTFTSTTNASRSVSSYPSSKSDSVQKSFYHGVQVFTYVELEEATKNFDSSREIGEGGFGTVYKGELQDGRMVAVKRHYESNFKRVDQFMNEVEILARLRHKNLVTLFGCTSRHSRELLLVYEFVSNGTVADHVHGKRSKSSLLPWPVRLNIAVETAEALAYLHSNEVIHRDVKSNNILLDEKFHVKVADFGLSRLFPTDVTHVSTAPQGTPGYVDPEYHQCYQLTDKSDVYSFGVVLVELISSLQAVDISRHRNDVNLASMAINKIQNQALHELVDPFLGFDKDYAVRRMTTAVAELAFRCLQQQREMRPSMDEVLEILRAIKSDELGAREAEVLDIKTEEIILLEKVSSPVSPSSVADKWVSSSTTSNSY